MSRCFPYPPPGYLRQGLIDESIKLKREKVLPKTEQKLHKKREREIKKEKKGKDKSQCLNKKLKKLGDVVSGSDNQSDKSDHTEEHGPLNKKLKKLDDVVNGSDNQSEKSDLTEEHGPSVCYTSDDTQNSHKRKRVTVSSRECKVDGNKIKIRFSFKKPRVSDALVSEEPVCSSSVRAESVQEQSCTIAPLPEQKLRHAELSLHEQKPRHDELPVREQKLPHDGLSVPEQNPHHGDGRKEQCSSSSRRSSKDRKLPKAVLQFKTLIEDWMPPLLQLEHNDDDDNSEDWLFSTKHLVKPVAKRTNDNDVACRTSEASFPRAHFLPEAEIYALPYTVPF